MQGRKAYWARVVAEQEAGEESVRGFCRRRKVNEHSFYMWRKRLREGSEPLRFALVETASESEAEGQGALELVLTTGERLHIGPGVSAELIRTVLGVLRA